MTWFFKKEIKQDEEKFKIKTIQNIEKIPEKETFLSFYIDLEVVHPEDQNMAELIKNLELGFNLPKNCKVTDSHIRRIQVLENKPF